MATRTYTKPQTGNTQIVLASWEGLQVGDDGEDYPFGWYADRTMQVTGTFGVGGTVVVEGSHDGLSWVTLHDAFGNLVSFTAPGMALVAEITRFIRPRVSGGDGTTNITALLLGRATQ